MSRPAAPTTLLLALVLLAPACSWHETAREWHGLVDEHGETTYVATTTKVACRLFVLIPFLGNVQIDGMVSDLTGFVAELGGDEVDIIQVETVSYWYVLFPLTYVFTPVETTITAEFHPPPDLVAADQAVRRARRLEEEAAAREEAGGDGDVDP